MRIIRSYHGVPHELRFAPTRLASVCQSAIEIAIVLGKFFKFCTPVNSSLTSSVSLPQACPNDPVHVAAKRHGRAAHIDLQGSCVDENSFGILTLGRLLAYAQPHKHPVSVTGVKDFTDVQYLQPNLLTCLVSLLLA